MKFIILATIFAACVAGAVLFASAEADAEPTREKSDAFQLGCTAAPVSIQQTKVWG